MMYGDVDCTQELSAASFELASESATHAWQKRAEKGWGYLADQQGAFIHEPLIGGSRISVHLQSAPRCLKISTCFDAPGRRRAHVLQSSDEAEALASAQAEANVCDDHALSRALSLCSVTASKLKSGIALLQYEGTGVSDGVLNYGGAKHKVRTFNFKNADFTTEGAKIYSENR